MRQYMMFLLMLMGLLNIDLHILNKFQRKQKHQIRFNNLKELNGKYHHQQIQNQLII